MVYAIGTGYFAIFFIGVFHETGMYVILFN